MVEPTRGELGIVLETRCYKKPDGIWKTVVLGELKVRGPTLSKS